MVLFLSLSLFIRFSNYLYPFVFTHDAPGSSCAGDGGSGRVGDWVSCRNGDEGGRCAGDGVSCRAGDGGSGCTRDGGSCRGGDGGHRGK